MINNVLNLFALICLVWGFAVIKSPPKRKDEKYLVIILLAFCGIIFFVAHLYACGWVNNIPDSTDKRHMDTAVTDLSLLYALLILSIMLLIFLILIEYDIIIKSKSLSLRTEFNLMSLIYFIIMIVVCAYFFYELRSKTTDAKDFGEAIIVWWLILLFFVPNWLVYFLLCFYITKIKLNQRVDLLIEKSIKSCLIGIAAWSVLFFNLKGLLEIPEFLNYFKYLCFLGSVFPIFYPLLDTYEYTILEIKDTLY